MYLLLIWRGTWCFWCGQIHFKDHWKGVGPKNRYFVGPWNSNKRSDCPLGPKKSKPCRTDCANLANVEDIYIIQPHDQGVGRVRGRGEGEGCLFNPTGHWTAYCGWSQGQAWCLHPSACAVWTLPNLCLIANLSPFCSLLHLILLSCMQHFVPTCIYPTDCPDSLEQIFFAHETSRNVVIFSHSD